MTGNRFFFGAACGAWVGGAAAPAGDRATPGLGAGGGGGAARIPLSVGMTNMVWHLLHLPLRPPIPSGIFSWALQFGHEIIGMVDTPGCKSSFCREYGRTPRR